MKTKAAVLRNIGGPLVIEELEIPKLRSGQVLVKILHSGLCRSQLNEIGGWKGKDYIPHLLGHEASGVVLETGPGVTKVKPDEDVVCSWIKGKGIDASMVKYESKNGVVNAGAVATFCTLAVISENRLVKISGKIKPETAALLGCAVPTGAGIIDSFFAKKGDKIAVLGIGGIGASAMLRATSLKVDCLGFDISLQKVDWACKSGMTATFFNSIGGFSGIFDFAVECSGNKSAMEAAIDLVKDNGLVVIAGNLKPGEKIAIDPFELVKGKKIMGSWGGGCFLDKDIPNYATEYLSGHLLLDKLITKIYPFEKINSGLEELNQGKLIRGIIKIS